MGRKRYVGFRFSARTLAQLDQLVADRVAVRAESGLSIDSRECTRTRIIELLVESAALLSDYPAHGVMERLANAGTKLKKVASQRSKTSRHKTKGKR